MLAEMDFCISLKSPRVVLVGFCRFLVWCAYVYVFFLGHIERFAWSTYLFLCMYIIIDKAIRLGTRALYFVMMRFHAFALCV